MAQIKIQIQVVPLDHTQILAQVVPMNQIQVHLHLIIIMDQTQEELIKMYVMKVYVKQMII